MTETQAEALDMVHFIADEHKLEIKLQRGDIELVNNFALFHARREFTDEVDGKRHLIRLWLRSGKHAWEGPEVIRNSSTEIYDLKSPFRSKAIWDIYSSPPLGRNTYKRMDCN